MRRTAAVCVGEAMAALVPDQRGPLEEVVTFHQSVGGAEYNVARGLVRLGVPAAWISRVGDDGFGRRIVSTLDADGVDTSAVTVDSARPTGLYVKEIGPHGSAMHHYRRGSAASTLGPDLLDVLAARRLLDGADLLHLSGITAALSGSALELLRRLLNGRRRTGQLVSFDLNWRPALWPDPDTAASVLRPLLGAADIVLCGADEARAVLGTSEPRELRAMLPRPAVLVIKDDARTATAVDRDSTATTEPALQVEVVERVGAGDAFAAGYLAGILRGYSAARRLRLGHLAAAATLVVPGDHGAPPPPGTVEALLACQPEQWAATVVSAKGVRRG